MNEYTQEPNWTLAPKWAMFWTRDFSGVTIWWETKPFHDAPMGIWICNEDNRREICISNVQLIRKRPQHQEQSTGETDAPRYEESPR